MGVRHEVEHHAQRHSQSTHHMNNIVKGKIARITCEHTAAGNRFVLSLSNGTGFDYFSTPLSSPDSVRINTQQLRAGVRALLNVENVFLHLLTHMNEYIGTEIEYSISEQVDKSTGQAKLSPKTGKPYTNVRIEPSSQPLSEADAMKLLGLAGISDSDDIPN